MVIEDEEESSKSDSSSRTDEGDIGEEVYMDSSESEDEEGLTAWDWIGGVGEQEAMEIGACQSNHTVFAALAAYLILYI